MMIAETLRMFIMYAVFFLRLNLLVEVHHWLPLPKNCVVVKQYDILPSRKVRDIVNQ